MIQPDTERLVMRIGHKTWKDTYGSGGGEADAVRAVADYASKNQDPLDDQSATDFSRFLFAVQWINAACVTLVTSHKFCAALALSKVSDASVFDDIQLPATTFRVQVPAGVIRSDVHGLDIGQINVCVLGDGRGMLTIEGEGGPDTNGTGRVSVCVPYSSHGGIGSLLAETDDEEFSVMTPKAVQQHSSEYLETKRRATLMAKRIVAGLLLTLAHTSDWKDHGEHVARGKRHDPRDPPKHRTIYIGRPIDLDARSEIHDYLDGSRKRAAPSVQTLVRGHYRRQAIGAGRAERKVIWIKPYWKGDEEAPILSRPIRVG